VVQQCNDLLAGGRMSTQLGTLSTMRAKSRKSTTQCVIDVFIRTWLDLLLQQEMHGGFGFFNDGYPE
jgi:hypothetical protein